MAARAHALALGCRLHWRLAPITAMPPKLDVLDAASAEDWWRRTTQAWLRTYALRQRTPLESYARQRAALEWIELPCRPTSCGGSGGLNPGSLGGARSSSGSASGAAPGSSGGLGPCSHGGLTPGSSGSGGSIKRPAASSALVQKRQRWT